MTFAITSSLSRSTFAIGLTLAMALGASTTQAADFRLETVMSGLASPRGLSFGPGGALYVTEAGAGGNGPSLIAGNGLTNYFGYTGGVSRLFGGVQTRVLSGLPSLAPLGGGDATGLQDIVFDGSLAYGLFGLGSSPAQRANLGAFGASYLGTLAQLGLNGSGAVDVVADFAAYEGIANPDQGIVDSNPYGLARTPDNRFVVADAGGNTFLRTNAFGTTQALGVLPTQPNPLPFGPPTIQSVPTSVAIGPDGNYYIGQLTGFPFPAGAANVYSYDPVTATTSIAYGGFTNIIDLEFDASGNLYVLQLTTNGIASPAGPGNGLLLKIDGLTGERTTIASDGLQFPGGIAIQDEADGVVLYVTNHANLPGSGEVLRISAVPEPGTWALLLGGLICVGARVKRRV